MFVLRDIVLHGRVLREFGLSVVANSLALGRSPHLFFVCLRAVLGTRVFCSGTQRRNYFAHVLGAVAALPLSPHVRFICDSRPHQNATLLSLLICTAGSRPGGVCSGRGHAPHDLGDARYPGCRVSCVCAKTRNIYAGGDASRSTFWAPFFRKSTFFVSECCGWTRRKKKLADWS